MPTRFRLDVHRAGANNAVLETFANLSMTATDPRFAPAVINGRSAFIDKLTASSATTPADATVALTATTGGDDGTVIGPADGAFQTALTDRSSTVGGDRRPHRPVQHRLRAGPDRSATIQRPAEAVRASAAPS